MNYSVKKALACQRYDLIVNGITVASRDTRVALNQLIASFITQGLLLEEVSHEQS